MAVAGTSSANVISFSDNVSFDHDHVVTTYVYNCPGSLDYTFLSDTVSLSQFDTGLGILNSVELVVESTIDVETHYWYAYDYAYATMWWYSDVIGSADGLEATFSQGHEHHTIGDGYHDYAFKIDGTASDSASSGLAGFIGTGLVDVAITGDDKLCAWWNGYTHYDTDTYGIVTATLTYNYTPVEIDIKPGSCPNPFNPKSKGSVPVAIVGTGELDVTTIDPDSLMLNGVPIVEDNILYADVTQPNDGSGDAEECEVCFEAPEEYSGDGYMDLVVKFDTQALAVALSGAEKDACIELTLTGETMDGIPFAGSDSMLILKDIDGN